MHKVSKSLRRNLLPEITSSNSDIVNTCKQQDLSAHIKSTLFTSDNSVILHKPSVFKTNREGVEEVVCCRSVDNENLLSYELDPVLETDSNKFDLFTMNSIGDYVYEEHVETDKYVETVENNEVFSSCNVNQKNIVDLQHWLSLKDKFDSLFENWESDRSVERYEALKVALTYLENCDFKSRETEGLNNGLTKLYNIGNGDSKSSGIVVIEIPKSVETKHLRPMEHNKRSWTSTGLNDTECRMQSYASSSSVNVARDDNLLEDMLNFNEDKCYRGNSTISTSDFNFHCDPQRENTLLDHKYVKKINGLR